MQILDNPTILLILSSRGIIPTQSRAPLNAMTLSTSPSVPAPGDAAAAAAIRLTLYELTRQNEILSGELKRHERRLAKLTQDNYFLLERLLPHYKDIQAKVKHVAEFSCTKY